LLLSVELSPPLTPLAPGLTLVAAMAKAPRPPHTDASALVEELLKESAESALPLEEPAAL
jgi:hypothetical protein